MASFRNRNKRIGGGSNPGLTPIDDIQGNTSRSDLDPDSETGRMPALEETNGRKRKRGRSSRKNNRKSS